MVSDSGLFRPTKVGSLALQHRVVLAPMARYRCDANHVPVDMNVTYYAQRTSPGGLLITETTAISIEAGPYPGAPGIFTDDQVEGWKKVTAAVHAKGGFIFMQLWHAGRITIPDYTGGNQPVSASPIAFQEIDPYSGTAYPVPRALTVEEIKRVVLDYAQAAKNAIAAGFDGVEVHSAYGYLLHQFLSTDSNARTDPYGGSIPNRARFALEVVDAVANAIGVERVAIRFSPWHTLRQVKDDTAYATYDYILKHIQAHHPGLAYLHFVEPRDDIMLDMGVLDIQDHPHESLDPFRAVWKGPFISSGGFSTRFDLAFQTAERTGNLIAFGRTFTANPDLVDRLKNGWPISEYDRATFFTPTEKGYTDPPFYQP